MGMLNEIKKSGFNGNFDKKQKKRKSWGRGYFISNLKATSLAQIGGSWLVFVTIS